MKEFNSIQLNSDTLCLGITSDYTGSPSISGAICKLRLLPVLVTNMEVTITPSLDVIHLLKMAHRTRETHLLTRLLIYYKEY